VLTHRQPLSFLLEERQFMDNEDVQLNLPKPTPSMRRYAISAAVLLVVFLLGFIPMWLKSRKCANGLAGAEHQLVLLRMQSNLASAAIDARRGDYEPARQAASQFFTSLRAEIDKGKASAFTQTQAEGMQTLFAGRDEIITLLARSDPASADRLSDLYVTYRKAVSG
jgi:hypothetical protein